MQPTAQAPQYGNWISPRRLKRIWALTGVSALVLAAALLWGGLVLSIAAGVFTALMLARAVVMQLCYRCFSFSGGQLMGKFHAHLLEHLPWDGQGQLLDIGCGSGALTLRCARQYPGSQVVGMDAWGPGWEYDQEQCQQNARLEGVTTARFVPGDAAALPFSEGTFDAVVSNFVFHEVSTVKDKHMLLVEALRVVKPGGYFAFHDLFGNKRMYGDVQDFLLELQSAGATEIHYEPHTEKLPFVPGYVRLMVRRTGIIYGRK